MSNQEIYKNIVPKKSEAIWYKLKYFGTTVNPKIFVSKNFRVKHFRVKKFSDASVCPKIKNTDNF